MGRSLNHHRSYRYRRVLYLERCTGHRRRRRIYFCAEVFQLYQSGCICHVYTGYVLEAYQRRRCYCRYHHWFCRFVVLQPGSCKIVWAGNDVVFRIPQCQRGVRDPIFYQPGMVVPDHRAGDGSY